MLFPKPTDKLDCVKLGADIRGQQRFVAVDVGAANGLLPHWQWLDGVAHVFQIEPRIDACKELEALRVASRFPDMYTVIAAALSGEGGPRTLYVTNAPTGTSLLPPARESDQDCTRYVDPAYIFPITEQVIDTRSLVTVMHEQGESRIDLIKLDIQGAELEVLKGLGTAMRRDLLAVELEVGMHALYPREARFSAVEEYMSECNMELFDVRVARVHQQYQGSHDYYQKQVFSVYGNTPTISARLWEFDALYFRKRSDVLRRGDPELVCRMLIAYSTYNYFAEAYTLIDDAEKKAILSRPEADRLQQAIVDLHHVRLYRPWLADTPTLRWFRNKIYPFVPRSAPRWCQYMYQNYPNG